ncbi:MAG: citrate lyase holo-[acyl-carrier protein] synthase [Oscillospiraceae bacterium]|nr:citrate lyase holo-[acyl-carrier protein] synthase [Oscillospiraceae bacterium]
MREITLAEMLDAREARALRQQELLREYRCPLVSFTLNIPGPVKDSPLIRRGYETGRARLEAALKAAGTEILRREEKLAPTGPELLLAVDADAAAIKALCLAIEDWDALGRLFDLDVLAPDGEKLERTSPRRCLVCGRPGRDCASRRLHSVEELQRAVRRILTDSLTALDAERVSRLCTRALIEELETTPKPGLVDLDNNGAHLDMCPETFYRSAEALKDYWRDCFLLGARRRADAPEACFAALRLRGIEAERAMLAATGGVNTHKGMIFTLGAVCGAIGRLSSPEAPCRDPEPIAAEAAALCREAVDADFAAVRNSGAPRSAGERLYLKFGLAGIRGELASGLPGVLKYGLPELSADLAEGLSRNDAGVYALLRLMARGTDSNLAARGGPEKAAQVSAKAAALLPRPPMDAVRSFDRELIEAKLSPGGCADLLAVSYFLYDWARDTGPSQE